MGIRNESELTSPNETKTPRFVGLVVCASKIAWLLGTRRKRTRSAFFFLICPGSDLLTDEASPVLCVRSLQAQQPAPWKLVGSSSAHQRFAWISLTDNRPQQSHTLQNVWDFSPILHSSICLTVRVDSREDQDTAQPTITGQQEAWLAAVRKGLVCGMYNIDNRELFESWNKCVFGD